MSTNFNAVKIPLLDVRNLKKNFPAKRLFVKAVDDVSFSIFQGETFGLVGESGCGKSTTGRTILRLIEPTEGEIYFEGENLLNLSKRKMRARRRDMQIIFQDPYSSLNPRITIGNAIREPLIIHNFGNSKHHRELVLELLNIVGLSSEHYDRYPHEFSGGQRQRISIARALILNPKFVVADEPVSALDVSVQAQIVNLLQDLQDKFQLTYLFISHSLSVVEHICTRVGVMYLGKLVEIAETDELFSKPLHPYTQILLSSILMLDPVVRSTQKVLIGDIPSPLNPPTGCKFHTRCPYAKPECNVQEPPMIEVSPKHFVACWLLQEP